MNKDIKYALAVLQPNRHPKEIDLAAKKLENDMKAIDKTPTYPRLHKESEETK